MNHNLHRNSIHAFIDLGTNTFHLLIAEIANEEATILFRTKVIVGLGAGGINNNRITSEAQHRGLTTLKKFSAYIASYNVSKVSAFGTSALRNAENSSEFISLIQKETKIQIDVIDGNREAELIHLGIAGHEFVAEFPYLIMDIGGGSTEFIVANENTILWKKSFEVGVQRLIADYFDGDPPSKASITQLNQYLALFLNDLQEVKAFNVKDLIGASGTFTTLLNMYIAASDHNKSNMEVIPRSFFKDIFKDLLRLPRAERIKMPGMSAPRADLIIMGGCLVNFVLDELNIDKFYVSDNGLKEGALILAQKGKL